MSGETKSGPGGLLLKTLIAPAVWLERARGRRRTVLIVLYAAIATTIGIFGWRNWALRSIPNVPDPFADLPSELSIPTPSGGAGKFSLYKQALSRYRPLMINNQPMPALSQVNAGWKQASVEKREWLKANREALDLWLKASEMEPEQASSGGVELITMFGYMNTVQDFLELCAFEADRLENQGDMAGAWRWHRAELRSSLDISANSPVQLGNASSWTLSSASRPGLQRWVADPRVTLPMLASARQEVVELGSRPLVNPEALRTIYQGILDHLDEPSEAILQSAESEVNQPRDVTQWYHTFPPTRWARWFLLNEPERGKRVTRLIFANYRDYLGAPGKMRSSKSPYHIAFTSTSGSGQVFGIAVLFGDPMAARPGVPSRATAIPLMRLGRGGVPAPMMIPTPGTPSALPPKLAVIEAGLQSSPLLRRILVADQSRLPIGAAEIQSDLDAFLGLIDSEIEFRKLPPERHNTYDPNNPPLIPGGTVFPE